MSPSPSSQFAARAERTIALTRVALAAFSLLAIWLDPADPARYAETTYGLHTAYVSYSIALAAIMWQRRPVGWLPIVTHVVDMILFSIFQYLTLGISSPFVAYFVFSLFCGALRWGWRGALGTAPPILVSFVVMGVTMSRSLGPTAFELNRFVISTGYLLMVAGLLVYLGRHEARLREEIERLAGWPVPLGDDRDGATRRVLEHAANVMRATRAVAVWERGEEPDTLVAAWSADTFAITRHTAGTFDAVVAAPLREAVFGCVNAGSGECISIVQQDGRVAEWRGSPVDARLLAALPDGGLASAPFRTDRLSGRVLFAGLGAAAIEVLSLVAVVAREVGSSLDQFEMLQRQRELDISEERIHVARDLHDGVLQALTGVRLELQGVANGLDGPGAPAAREQLSALERALAIEQRDLRFFIENLKPLARPQGGDVWDRLDALRERMALEWKVPITLRIASPSSAVPRDTGQAIPPMVHEAVVNALKHGYPSRVAVEIDAGEEGVTITVTDDGRGFPFRGHYQHDALVRSNTGPASLLERVASLGGELTVDSSEAGARVEIRLPRTVTEG